MHARLAALGLILLLVVSAGCTAPMGLTQAEAETRAETAMASFAAAMSTRDGGDELKRLSGTMEGSGDDGADFGFDQFETTFDMEWGTGDVVHLQIEGGSGGFSMKAEAWCTPTQMFLAWGNEIYQSRPNAEPETDEWCPGDEAEAGLTTDGAFFEGEDFQGLERGEVTILDDGRVRAVYHDPNENATITATIDSQGRIEHVEMDSPEATGSFDVEYGTRSAIDIPEATERIPATVWTMDHPTEDSGVEGTIQTAPERPPLDEMELHVVRSDFDNETFEETRETLATFALTAESGSDGDYSFTYTDVDEDGRLSPNDTFTANGGELGSDHNVRVEFYDTWADAYSNENPMPGPGFALVALGLVGLLAVLRRQR